MRTLRTPGCSYSKAKGLKLSLPDGWKALTQDQLWYVFYLLARFAEPVEVKTYLLFRFSGMDVVRHTSVGCDCCLVNEGEIRRHYFHLTTAQIQTLIHRFDYVDHYETMGVRLERIQGFAAVDVILRRVAFSDYLNMERLYQQFLDHRDATALDRLAGMLYRNEDGGKTTLTLDDTERTAVFYWWTYLKSLYSRMFPHFFRPAMPSDTQPENYLQAANAQIRALTDGDVTKEPMVEQTECLRALTELNEKAREADEYKRKYGNS